MNDKGVPVIIKRTVHDGWQISFYEEFDTTLFSSGDMNLEIKELILFVEGSELQHGFRREIVINSFPFLCGVRPEEKSIYIGTRRLSRELSLLKLHEINPVLVDEKIELLFSQLKEHTEKISTLSPTQFPTEIEWVTAKNNLPQLLNSEQWTDVDEHASRILSELVKNVSSYRSSLFEKFTDYGLTLTAQYDLIRIHLLKFLALLPSLDHDKSGQEVKKNLLESLRRFNTDAKNSANQKKRGVRQIPLFLSILTSVLFQIASFLPSKFLASLVRFLVKVMAKRFIAGESINTAHDTLQNLRDTKRDATLDQLGELVVSAREADIYFEKVLQLISGFKQHIPKGEKNKAGIQCAHVSIKVSALSQDFKAEAFDDTYSKVAPRLRRILQEAHREEVFLNIDAESFHYRDLVLKIYSKVLLETPELAEYGQTGIVIQAYLRDGAKHFSDVIKLARERNIRMPIRLVKGAYWDAETIEGEAHQFVPPQFLNKEESDLHFRQLAYMALKNHDCIQLAIGSHNLQDHVFVESLRELRFPQAPVIEHQCLHMTYEALSHGLRKMGYPVRNYMPIGNLLVGMAYLVRRIMENSSQVGILSIMRSHQKASGLISPVEVHLQKKKNGEVHFDSFLTQFKNDFAPTRPLRLYITHEREALEKAMKTFDDNIMSSQEQYKDSPDTKINCSSRPELILGTIKENTNSETVKMVDEAEAGLAQSWWGKQSLTLYRISVLLKASDMMLLKRNSLAAIMIYEAGKTMSEALADVDEAIDFINFYTRQEIKIHLGNEHVTNRGVIAVIAPWNFPLAIPCGMAVAPLVAGNAVVLKPSEQTPLIALELQKIFIDAGVPADIFRIVQGKGEIVGSTLVNHPKIAGVVFTGSKQVGSWIYKNSAHKLIEHYHHKIPMQKKVITEMGGKNAVIVTNNCELDETIAGILYAAFAHSGQKCSAASRLIVHREVKDALIARLVQAVKDLKVGESFDPATFVNPLIGQREQDRVRKAIEEAKEEAIRVHGKILIDRSFEKLPGYCVGPAVFELPPKQTRNKDSWAQKEIFGPVIHITEFNSLVEAVELFNNTEYALTGGIFSQSQDDIDFLTRFLRAGNLYVNRPNTGARVAIEPFGGFKLSGTGPKAGSFDYVKEFHYQISPEENSLDEIKWVKDSGYELITPRASLISVPGRIARFEKFGHAFLEQYEIFIGAVSEKEKSQLTHFIDWVNSHLKEYLHGRHPNYTIPGQLSFNDKSIIKDAGLFVTVSARPSVKSVQYLFGALALGCGVSVACVTEESYVTWKGILDLAWKAGFSKTNIDCALISRDALTTLFKKSCYSFLYAGRYAEFHDLIYKDILEGDALNENMRLILSESDGVSIGNPVTVLDQFVWQRSFAVNTMRYGAPLALNE